MNKQKSLSAFDDELAQVRTKKKEFLAKIDRTITKESAETSPTIWN